MLASIKNPHRKVYVEFILNWFAVAIAFHNFLCAIVKKNLKKQNNVYTNDFPVFCLLMEFYAPII